jgi:hypothetical protein
VLPSIISNSQSAIRKSQFEAAPRILPPPPHRLERYLLAFILGLRHLAPRYLFGSKVHSIWSLNPFLKFRTPTDFKVCAGVKMEVMASTMITKNDRRKEGVNNQSIEERNFQAALLMTECHFTKRPPVGRKTVNKTLEAIRRTMEKTLNQSEIRYTATHSRNYVCKWHMSKETNS